MKKKIINGILMVALLAATTTSFVSCKDNDEDVKTDLIAQLNKKAGDLDAAYKQADTDLNNAIQTQLANKADKVDLDNFKTLVATDYAKKADVTKEIKDSLAKYATKDYVDAETKKLWDALNDPDDPNSVANQLADLNGELADQAEDIEDIQEDIENIEDTLDELQKQIDSIIKTFEKMVTSVTVNGTASSILNNSKVFPGLNIQILGAAYGEPIKAQGQFPSTDASLYVDGNALSADAISGVEAFTWKDNELLTSKDKDGNNAGTVYFTLNPSNIKPKALKSLTLVNNLQEEIFELGEATPCDEVMNWGITRADGEKDVTYDAVMYQAPAKYDAESVKAIELKNIIDYKAIAKNVKNIINEAKAAASDVNRSNYSDVAKSTSKAVLKETAQAVANLVNGKIPAMPAVALKATWADTVGTRSVLSDYSIAATAYKPLSFAEFKDVDFSAYSISLDKFDNLAKRIADKIKAELNKLNGTISNYSNIAVTINIDESKFKLNKSILMVIKTGTGSQVTSIELTNVVPVGATKITSGTTFAASKTYYTETTVEQDLSAEIAKLKTVSVDMSGLTNEISSLISRVNNAADRAVNLENRVSNFLENTITRVLNNVDRALEPILLVDTKDGIQRVSGTYKAGKFTFVPTTMTYELVAPAFKKYVAVLKDGKPVSGKQYLLTKGEKGFSSVDIELAAGETQIVYAAMDFRGYQIAKVYNITVE